MQYKLIEIFSIVFYDFFPSFRIMFSSTAARHPELFCHWYWLNMKSPFLNPNQGNVYNGKRYWEKN